jgi:signal transduction histidine kinase
VEIYPPELRTEGLAAALDDLVAPAIASGVQVRLNVDGTDGAREESIALVWRAAQEAVRNALRHGSPSSMNIAVTSDGEHLSLTVEDDGVGFDPGETPRDGHLGLRGLRDLIIEMNGSFEIDSAPGEGTRVKMEVSR